MKTATDRRAGDRSACSLQGHCLFPQDREAIRWPATVRDISAAGIGWTLDCSFEPGTILNLCVRNDARAVRVNKSVEVRHVHWDEPRGWHLGGTFLTSLSEEELTALL